MQVGDRFERWEILSLTSNRKRYVVAKCSCGTIKEVSKPNILSGKSKSCGCLSIELTKEREKTPWSILH